MAKKPGKKIDKKSSSRGLHVNVKTAANRSNSSARWLARQLNDPYVAKSKIDGYRSRAAYKILELDEKFHLFQPGMKVVDLGCAPGGWAQVAVSKIAPGGKVVGCDLLPVPEIPGATLIVQDFLADDAPEILKKLLGGKAGLVMSDMAANTTGHGPTDHLRIMHLCEIAYHFACEILEQGGTFTCKVLKGGAETQLLKQMQRDFTSVKHAKPKSSRADSAESYVVATGFRG